MIIVVMRNTVPRGPCEWNFCKIDNCRFSKRQPPCIFILHKSHSQTETIHRRRRKKRFEKIEKKISRRTSHKGDTTFLHATHILSRVMPFDLFSGWYTNRMAAHIYTHSHLVANADTNVATMNTSTGCGINAEWHSFEPHAMLWMHSTYTQHGEIESESERGSVVVCRFTVVRQSE